ncbi:uncharacterized protein F4812DRAFT_463718 [Daldinia caldariorum]|uniref:uncharacterized protein n=1 Tax=Daldinia caldariorum TaxID=326644 RepID=UPI002007E108|nr:uncharacterized protein F4812DRAFT_463718 [Daldinia caldariorum]KAI1463383.1 hypothetical protein F4812DRAFT_463718 [Daldinia caldariorum]
MARLQFYPKTTPQRVQAIQSRVRKHWSSNSRTSSHTSTTSPISAEMPQHRLAPSSRELIRKLVRPVKRSGESSSSTEEGPDHIEREARFVAAVKAFLINATPVVNFWQKHNGVPSKLAGDPIINALLEEGNTSLHGDIIKSCANAVIQHFSFQGKFSEIQYLINDETQISWEVYVAQLNILAQKMYKEAKIFFYCMDANLKWNKAHNKQLYSLHKRWNESREREGHGQYPGLARGLPSPLRSELRIDNSDADQSSSSTDGVNNDNDCPDLNMLEDYGAEDLEGVEW